MADYLIVAREQIYNGVDSIEDWVIQECANVEEAFAIGREMSLDLIDSYMSIYNIFKENAENWADEIEEEDQHFNREDYIEAAIEQQREDDISFQVWKLSDRFDYSKITSENDDWRDIVENYAEEEF